MRGFGHRRNFISDYMDAARGFQIEKRNMDDPEYVFPEKLYVG